MQHKNLLSLVNKIINGLEIKLQRTNLISKPVELVIEPTLQCNSNCIMCNRNFNRKKDQDNKGFLSWDIFYKISPFFKYAQRILFSGFGEPLLHPEYAAMLSKIKKYNPFVYLFSNGTLLNEELSGKLVDLDVDMICISIGGATSKTHMKIRGVDTFKTVINNIKMLTEYKRKTKKRKPLISFNVVAMNSILHELEALVVLAKEIGVERISLPNMVVQGKEMEAESVWCNPEYAKAAFKKAKALAAKNQIEFFAPQLDIERMDCKDLFKRMTVTYDGKVLSCPMERFVTGNLKKETINHIWNNRGMIELRKKYYSRGLEHLCPNCTCWDNRREVFLNPWFNSREFAQSIYSE